MLGRFISRGFTLSSNGCSADSSAAWWRATRRRDLREMANLSKNHIYRIPPRTLPLSLIPMSEILLNDFSLSLPHSLDLHVTVTLSHALYLSSSLSLSLSPSFSLSLCLYHTLSTCPYVSLSLSLSISLLSTYLSFSIPLSLSLFPSLCFSIYLSLPLSLSLTLHLSLSSLSSEGGNSPTGPLIPSRGGQNSCNTWSSHAARIHGSPEKGETASERNKRKTGQA